MKAIRLGLMASVIVTMSAACTSTGAAPPAWHDNYNLDGGLGAALRG